MTAVSLKSGLAAQGVPRTEGAVFAAGTGYTARGALGEALKNAVQLALQPLQLLHPPGDPEHSVSFAWRRWMPVGWPTDERSRPVRGNVARAVDHHPPGWLWEPLWNVHSRDLQEVFRQIVEQLLNDSFVSVCGMMVPHGRTPTHPALGEYRFEFAQRRPGEALRQA